MLINDEIHQLLQDIDERRALLRQWEAMGERLDERESKQMRQQSEASQNARKALIARLEALWSMPGNHRFGVRAKKTIARYLEVLCESLAAELAIGESIDPKIGAIYERVVGKSPEFLHLDPIDSVLNQLFDSGYDFQFDPYADDADSQAQLDEVLKDVAAAMASREELREARLERRRAQSLAGEQASDGVSDRKVNEPFGSVPEGSLNFASDSLVADEADDLACLIPYRDSLRDQLQLLNESLAIEKELYGNPIVPSPVENLHWQEVEDEFNRQLLQLERETQAFKHRLLQLEGLEQAKQVIREIDAELNPRNTNDDAPRPF